MTTSPQGQPTPSPQPLSANFSSSEVATLRATWQQNPEDIGLIVYRPSTGTIHLGNFDAHGGHDLFLQNLGYIDDVNWLGASISSGGVVINNSGLNVGQSGTTGQRMAPSAWQEILQACRNAGLSTQPS